MSSLKWSYSSLGLFQQCPKKYYHLRVAKDVKEPETEAILYGKRVHEAAEFYISKGTPLPPPFEQFRDVLDMLKEMPGDKLCEYKMGLTSDLQACGFFDENVWFRGVADLVIINGEVARVIDYKTGKSSEYATEVPTKNTKLFKHFSHVYKELQDYFEALLGEKVYLNDKLAYPSFHIAAADPFFLTHGGEWHHDFPHKTLGLGDVDPLTFTVAIELPYGGGGLDYLEDGKPEHLPYTEGQIVVHDGSIVHRIAPFKECIRGDYRITLQGHLIRHNGFMTMFW